MESRISLRVVGTYLLWIDNTLAFFPKVSFQTQHHDRNSFALAMLEITNDVVAPLFDMLSGLGKMNDRHLGQDIMLTPLSPSNVWRFEISNARTTTFGWRLVQC